MINNTDVDGAKRIIVNLKFSRSKDGKLMGFVTRYGGSWHGCRAEEPKPKKIVLLDIALADVVMANVLYRVSLIPMHNDGGFVAISASPVQFDAAIETVYDGAEPHLEVRFGNKTVSYYPNSQNKKFGDIDTIVSHLLHRLDIRNVYEVTQEFLTTAHILRQHYYGTVGA